MTQENERFFVQTMNTNNEKIKLTVKMPGHKLLQDAQMVYNVAMTAFIKQSANGESLLSRDQLERYLSEIGVWTQDDAKKFLQLQIELRECELKLKTGGMKVSEARQLALRMKIKRNMLFSLYTKRSQFDSITMESMAENKKFKFLITKCVFYEDEDVLFFKNIEDYENRQEEKAVIDVTTAFAGRMYGYQSDHESNLTENEWLKKYGFSDDQGRLVDDCGRLVDESGRLIDEEGRFIDQDGNFVDNQGRRIDQYGEFVIENPKPFIDDLGVTKKTRTTKKKKTKKQNKKIITKK